MHFPALESTNQYALEMVSKTKPNEGTVISTFNQTAGRGQIGSRWESEPGQNIAMSLIVYPSFLSVRRQFFLNQMAALAVSDLAARYIGSQVKVKWPNDIYWNDRKLAGILIQNTLAGHRIQSTVVGIGLNVNQTLFSPELPNPVSMALITGNSHDLSVLIRELCLCLEHRYLQLRDGMERDLHDDYLARLYRFGAPAGFEAPERGEFEGVITGIDETGKLVIRSGEEELAFGFKEVRFL